MRYQVKILARLYFMTRAAHIGDETINECKESGLPRDGAGGEVAWVTDFCFLT